MLNGWICLHRKMLSHWIAGDPAAFSVWVTMLLEANHEAKKTIMNGAQVNLERGQLIFGLNAFSQKTGVSISTLRRILRHLENDNMISKQSFSKYSVITVLCYDQYQSIDKQNASKTQAESKQGASKTQHRNKETNKQNNNNNSNDKKTNKFVAPTLEELKDYFEKKIGEKNLNICAQSYAEKFINHYESNGWKVGKNKMKSWTHAVNLWINRAIENGDTGRVSKINNSATNDTRERRKRVTKAIMDIGDTDW